MTQVRGSIVNGVRTGIFESTNIDNKRYVTRLEFVNQPLVMAGGGTSAFASLCLMDFAAGIRKFTDTVVDLSITPTVAPTAPYTANFVIHRARGAVAADDNTTNTTSGTYELQADAAKTASGGVDVDKVQLNTNVVHDGSAGAWSIFYNALTASQNAAQTYILNGFINLIHEDEGIA